MSKARATWWRRRSPSEPRNSCIPRRPASTGCRRNPSTKPRQSSARTASITRGRKPPPRRRSHTELREGLDAVLLNPANVIGRYDWSTWSQFIRLAANRQLFRIPPGRACYADVDAVVRAHVAAVDKGRTGENYLLGGSRGLLCRDRADGGQIARPADQYDSRPAGRVALAGRVLERISAITGREPMIYGGIGGDRDGEHRLPQRQGHARARLSARADRNHAEGLHRLDGRREPHHPTAASAASFAPGFATAPARREMEKRLNIRLMTRSYRRGGISRLKRALKPSDHGK